MKAPFTALLLAATPALAQVYTPPSGNETPANNGGDTVIQRQPQEKKSAPVLGSELPFLDPSSELVSWNGHTWAATDNRLLAARFERYLNEPEDDSEAAVTYRETIEQILDYVSPHHAGGPDFQAAVALLPRASSFPGDAKLCDSLSQAIYAAYLSKKDLRSTKSMLEAMEKEKQRMIHNADVIAQSNDLKTEQTTRQRGRSTTQKVNQEGTGTESLRYKDYLKRVAEIDALHKANRTKGELQLLQAKVEYQALMVQFFVQRRFQHVLMAARFYHQIFQDGDTKLRIDKKSDLHKMLTETFGTSPTVSALDGLASEAIRDVNKGVEAFQFLSERGELESASKRLSEAYMVGEFMPAIQTLPREEKRRVLIFVRDSYKLIAALDSKDYDTAQKLVDQLKAEVGDFDPTKAQAAIATYTRVSNMHIDSAKYAASQGDNEKAAVEIQKAMEVWPQNPKLAEFDQLVEQGSGIAKARNDFDRLLNENNYREIYRRLDEFIPAVAGDPRREDALRQIRDNLMDIEGAIRSANEYSKMGQPQAAWEQLAKLRERFPDDPNLGREIERLVTMKGVPEFVSALNKARDLEDRSDQQTGSALSWYLKARSLYPKSELAQQGIDRLVEQILPASAPSERHAAGDHEAFEN